MINQLFLNWIVHFVKLVKISTNGISPSDQHLLIFHEHGFHISLEVVEETKNVGLDLLTLPIQILHEFHPLDVNVFKLFKIAFHKFWYIKSLMNKHKFT